MVSKYSIKDLGTKGARTALESEFWQQAMFCAHFLLTSWSTWPPTTSRTGTVIGLVLIVRFIRYELGFLTCDAQVVALAEETQAVTTGTTTEGGLQDTGERATVGTADVPGVGGLVAAGDLGVIAALGLSLLEGGVVLDGVLGLAVAVGVRVVTTTAGLGKGHHGSGEEKSSGEELHVDGWVGFCIFLRGRRMITKSGWLEESFSGKIGSFGDEEQNSRAGLLASFISLISLAAQPLCKQLLGVIGAIHETSLAQLDHRPRITRRSQEINRLGWRSWIIA